MAPRLRRSPGGSTQGTLRPAAERTLAPAAELLTGPASLPGSVHASSQKPEPRQVSGRLLVPAVRYLEERGVDARALFREVGLPPEVISDPDLRISSEAIRDLLALAVARSGDPAFGLHAGQRLRPGDLGLLEYLVRTSTSSEEIAQKLIRYH